MTRTCKDCPAVLPPSASPAGGRPRERCDACNGIHVRAQARLRQNFRNLLRRLGERIVQP